MSSALEDRPRSAAQGLTRPDETTDRVHYFDYLRMFATLGVVSIHASTQVYNGSLAGGRAHLGTFLIGDSGEALGRFAVGCFFMVSGALLLDHRHRFRLGKQVVRVAVPLLVWTVAYLAVNSWWAHRGLPTTSYSTDQTSSLHNALHAITSSAVSNHFWFVYALLACYLALPLLRPITALDDPRAKRLLEYALSIWAVTFVVIPTVDHYSRHAIDVYPDGLPSLPSKYLGFVLLGYYLHRYGVRIRGWRPGRIVLAGVAVASFLAIVLLTALDKLTAGGSGWGQTNPTPQVVLLGASVFLLAKQTFTRPGAHFAFVSLFSRLSFRIYLLHMLILFWLRDISPVKDLYKTQPTLSILVVGGVTLVVSFGIAYGLDRISAIRNFI